jgi:hypothetical protein
VIKSPRAFNFFNLKQYYKTERIYIGGVLGASEGPKQYYKTERASAEEDAR